MCGIVGVVSKHTNGFSSPEMDMFQNMLFVDTMRGWDSTGVFGVDNYGNVGIAKAAMHGADFICTKEFKEFKSHAIKNGIFAVGHNRAATRGTINDENAHPFYVEDKIVLVQNGSWRGCLTGWNQVPVRVTANVGKGIIRLIFTRNQNPKVFGDVYVYVNQANGRTERNISY